MIQQYLVIVELMAKNRKKISKYWDLNMEIQRLWHRLAMVPGCSSAKSTCNFAKLQKTSNFAGAPLRWLPHEVE